MRKLLHYIVLSSLVVLTACSSGEKALQHGNYFAAVSKSVDRLRSNPDKIKAQETLLSSYPLAVQWYEKEINNLQASADPFKNTKSVDKYQLLNRMYNDINRCPAAIRLIPNPKSYQYELEQAKLNAAPECYQAGLNALAKGGRQDGINAYNHFQKANGFVPNYKDVQIKLEEAEYMATLKVIIEHIPVNSQKYKLSSEFFQDQVTQYLFHNIKRRFVRFYTPKQAELEKLEYPDHIISMGFEDFIVGETHDTNYEKEAISADSVEVGSTTLKNGDKIKVYNKVKAKLHIHKREVISKGLLFLKVIEFGNQKIINDKRFGGQFIWFHEWGHFNGDERALSKEELEICEHEPILPPAHQDLFVEFTKPIYKDLTEELRKFYNRY
ncbi:hypothetical protein [Marinifilum flexuosum]|uniref:Lipoprotein n=1 Tax=Marinifilum flexuosum TaxID=1117708 RepID=A0A419XAE5_9BACT|nr:hypothetical protein [Marinifilum flexuosum]RKE04540.1 hypothetical protein BXY64_1566 [Marinifilum flexuosum]